MRRGKNHKNGAPKATKKRVPNAENFRIGVEISVFQQKLYEAGQKVRKCI